MILIAWAISFADDEWLIVLEMVSGVHNARYAKQNTNLTIPPAAQIVCVAII